MPYLFKNKLPEVDEIVIGTVFEINNYGIMVKLPQYNNIVGYISYNEASRKKKFNVKRLFMINKDILLIVINVDEKGYIDLSKRSINEDESTYFENKNKRYIILYNLFRSIYMKLNNLDNINNIQDDLLEQFMNETLWNIKNNDDKLMDSDEIYENIFNKNYDIILEHKNRDFIIDIIDKFVDSKNKQKPYNEKMFKLMSYNSTGLDDIKYILSGYNVNYMTNSIYKLTADISVNIDDIIDEIQKKSHEKNALFTLRIN